VIWSSLILLVLLSDQEKFSLSTVFVPPQLQQMKNAYPEIAHGAGGEDLEGTWIIGALITKDGMVRDLEISKVGVSDLLSLHPLVISQLQNSIRESRFKPANCNGRAMEAWYVNEITFRRADTTRDVPGEPVLHLTGGMVQPKLIKKVEMKWTAEDKKKRLNTLSIFEGVLTKHGFPTDFKVLRSAGDAETDCRAIDTINRWRYMPAMLNGRPVSVYFTVTVHIHFR
jgi:TonB family protein